jgi:hypothetical protein
MQRPTMREEIADLRLTWKAEAEAVIPPDRMLDSPRPGKRKPL